MQSLTIPARRSLSGDVGRRHDDGVLVFGSVRVGRERSALFPLRIDAVFEILGFVILGKIVFHVDPLYMKRYRFLTLIRLMISSAKKARLM